jgi:hypothetical protein
VTTQTAAPTVTTKRRASGGTGALDKPTRGRTTPRAAASKKTATPKKTVTPAASGRRQVNAPPAEAPEPTRPVAHALVAAERAVRRNSLHVQLPIVGELQMPAAEEVAFIGGVTALAVVGVLEWPVAVLLSIGHGLATARHNKLLRAFGEALEEA